MRRHGIGLKETTAKSDYYPGCAPCMVSMHLTLLKDQNFMINWARRPWSGGEMGCSTQMRHLEAWYSVNHMSRVYRTAKTYLNGHLGAIRPARETSMQLSIATGILTHSIYLALLHGRKHPRTLCNMNNLPNLISFYDS